MDVVGHTHRSPASADPARAHLPPLDGIRAAAVLAVVVFHARSDLLPGGYLGVDLFFVLSGFLITGILAREVDRTGRIDLRRFYLRRALRLMPALVLLCAVVVPLFWLLPVTNRSESLLGAGGAITYSSSILAASGLDLGWMLHTWSLSVEEYFYLVWPVALVLLARRRARLAVVVAVAGAAIAYRLMAAFGTDWTLQRIAYGPDTRAEQLLIGAVLALLIARGAVTIKVGHTVLATSLLGLATVLPADLGSELYRNGGSTLVALLAAVVIGGLVQSPTSLLSRVAATPVLVWVGRRSYGIYLWNAPLVAVVAATPLSETLQLPTKLLLTFVVPALSFRFVEQPFLAIKDRMTARTPRTDPTPTPGAATRARS